MFRGFTRAALGLSLPLLLFACGAEPSPSPQSTQDKPREVGMSWEHRSDAKAPAQSVAPGSNPLQYEAATYAHNGDGPIEKDTSNGGAAAGDGKTLTLNGQKYARGFGVHASAELRFDLAPSGDVACHTFSASVGVDDEVGAKGSVIFQVWNGAASKLFDSGKLTGKDAAKSVSVDVRGVNDLRLVVTDAGDGGSFDHADWADPALECAERHPSGSLDASFQRTGAAPYLTNAAALLGDGKILTRDASSVMRFNSDGTLDTTFGQGGKIAVASASKGDEKLLVQADGKIIVNSVLNGLGLTRYNADGSLDMSFGQGGSLRRADYVRALALQPDGKIIIAGNEAGDPDNWVVRRVNANGTLDTGFGAKGRIATRFDGGTAGGDRAYAGAVPEVSAVQPDGKIIVAGTASFNKQAGPFVNFEQGELAVARYNPDGTPDASFGAGGKLKDAAVSSSGNYQATPRALVLQPDGKIVLGGPGRAEGDGAGESFYGGIVARHLPGGARDSSFGADGLALFGLSDAEPCVTIDALALQRDGKVLLSGFYSGTATGDDPRQSCVKRLNPDGSIDPSFDSASASSADGQAILVQPDGRILFGAGGMVRVWP